MSKHVRMAFDPHGVLVPIANIVPLKQVSRYTRTAGKFPQVLASVREVGVVEPLIVFPRKNQPQSYILLDGHMRLEALKQLGETHASCLISDDDEAYTYNKRIHQLSTIREHEMILKAIKNGVPEDRVAKVLHVNVAKIRETRELSTGICQEASGALKNKILSPKVFWYLKMMKPARQIEVVELLSVANDFSAASVKALLESTSPDMLTFPVRSRIAEMLTPEQIGKMKNETEALKRDVKSVEESYSSDMLNLVLARGYLAKLLGNSRIVEYMGEHHSEILNKLRKVSDTTSQE